MNITDLAAGFSGTGWLPLADAILKATLLFAIAAIASLALRRGSAAARHLMWTLALVSALALPALSLALPRWQLPLVTVPSTSTSPVEAVSVPQPALGSTALAPAPPRLHTAARTAVTPAANRNVDTNPAVSRLSLPNISWPYALLTVWAVGAGWCCCASRPVCWACSGCPGAPNTSPMRRGCRSPARWRRSSGYRRGSCSCAAGIQRCRWRGGFSARRC